MAEVIRDVIVRIALEQKKATLKVPGLEKEIKGIEQLQKSITDAAATTVNENKKVAASFDDVRKKQAEQLKQAAESRQAIQDSSIKTVESFSAAGEGALIFTRGLTFLGIEAEDSLAKVTQNLAKVQGGIDLLKGGTQTFKGLIEGARAFKTATAGASGGLLGMAKNLNPVGLGLTAVTLAVTAGAAAWSFFGKEAKAAGDDAKEAGEKSKKAAEDLRKAQQDALNQARGSFGPGSESRELANFRIQEKALSIQQKLAEVESLRAINLKKLVNLTGLTGGLDAGGLADAAKTDAAELSLKLLKRGVINSEGKSGQEAAKSLIRFNEENIKLDRERLAIIRQQGEASRQLVENAKQETQAIKDKLDAERNRVQSLDERIGRLAPEQLLEFKQLAKKAQSGEALGRGELKRIEELGGSGTADFTSKGFQEFGRQSGGADLFSAFQGGKPQTGAGSQLEALAKSLTERQQLEKQITEKQQELLEASKESARMQVDLLEQQLEQNAELQSEVERIDRKLKNQSFNQRGGL